MHCDICVSELRFSTLEWLNTMCESLGLSVGQGMIDKIRWREECWRSISEKRCSRLDYRIFWETRYSPSPMTFNLHNDVYLGSVLASSFFPPPVDNLVPNQHANHTNHTKRFE
jgi:hypothetical protein